MIINPKRKTRRAFMVTSLSLVLLASCELKEKPMDTAELTEFATRYAAAWSSQDPAPVASFYADNGSLTVNDGEPSVGRDAVEQTARAFMTGFPDMVVRLVELRQEGDRVVFHWHWTGTNTGPGGTGNAVDIKGFEEWTIDSEGLILESLGNFDEAEYQRQLNAGPKAMIIRSWNARTTNELVADYLEQVQAVVIPHLNTFPGYKGAYFAKRDLMGDVEILVVTLWDSEESLRSFAGEEKEEAFMPPEIAATLVSYDHTSNNYEIMIGDD